MKDSVDGIQVHRDEAMVVYHAGPDKMGQFSMTVYKWGHEFDADGLQGEFIMSTPEHISLDLKKLGLKVRFIDERSGAMR
jgi:hypothetical protein